MNAHTIKNRFLVPSFYAAFLIAYLSAIFYSVLFLKMKLAALGSQSGEKIKLILLVFVPILLLGAAFCVLVLVPYLKRKIKLRSFLRSEDTQSVFKYDYFFSRETRDIFLKLRQQVELENTRSRSKWAEYLTLQSQINPHFLYNTLESIRGDALEKGAVQIAEIVEALAAFFRYTIAENDVLVTLEDELGNLDNYFLIQQYRFEDRIKLEVQTPPDESEIMKLLIPKLTLQPIVENAVVHGLESKSSGGVITIKIETTQTRLLIEVHDNGVGMDPEKLQQINDMLNSNSVPEQPRHGGIALNNVGKRIQLIFGVEYGLHVFSVQNEGTQIVVSMPKTYTKETVAALNRRENTNKESANP